MEETARENLPQAIEIREMAEKLVADLRMVNAEISSE